MNDHEGFQVTERIDRAQPLLTNYPLLPDDLLVREPGGTWTKEAPGLCVGGFVLTPEQEASLRPVRFQRQGLAYSLTNVGSGA